MKKLLLLPGEILLLMVLLFTARVGFGQSVPDSMRKKVDNIFKKWDKPNTPGCVVGVIRNDSLLYAKGYGLANMEDNIPNTPQSIYYMCSLAKQFTGYAIVLLAREGKLSLDDDIHRYLPWMADFGYKVTIRNLLNHTSGIRDEGDLAEIAGIPTDGILSQDYALDILKRQHLLNFIPGEKYSYSNSNYILLAEIVKVVSGQSFPEFAANTIFKPLGMQNSLIVANNTDLIKARAASYLNDEGKYENSFQNTYVLGAGSLFTNMDDMARWVMNFYSPKAGDAKDIEQLTERGKLNNGRVINYACGIAVDSSRGWKRFSHQGSLAGYRTEIAVYPDLKTGVLVFCNDGNDEIYPKVDQLAALFIPDVSKKKVTRLLTQRDSSAAFLNDTSLVHSFAGDYLAENGNQRKFSIINGKFWMNKRTLLIPETATTFYIIGYPNAKFTFHAGIDKEISADLTDPVLSKPIHFVKLVKGLQLPDEELQSYTGNYYCPELDCHYHIVLKDHQLWFTNILHPNAKITLMGKDDLLSGYGFFYHLKILRSPEKSITGFELNSGDMMHLRFNKIE
ncbi:MAG TPA: serine hydrolase domain-containing protein [Mucilaginibacter sp.]|jgi:CubicO group peptidase (beta-lactamase class C family)|nr:serine hydrolase domain-containing protein [Mucilaginibacter sp.]